MTKLILLLPIVCAGVSFLLFAVSDVPNWPNDTLMLARLVDLLTFTAAGSAGLALLTAIRD